MDVGVCCLLDFDFRSFVVTKLWSGKKQWKPGKELRIWRHSQDGPICDEPMERGSLGHVTPTGVTVLKDVRFFLFFFLYRCNQLPTL